MGEDRLGCRLKVGVVWQESMQDARSEEGQIHSYTCGEWARGGEGGKSLLEG